MLCRRDVLHLFLVGIVHLGLSRHGALLEDSDRDPPSALSASNAFM